MSNANRPTSTLNVTSISIEIVLNVTSVTVWIIT